MSTSIVSQVIGAETLKEVRLSNSSGARTFSVGSTWTTLRAGILFSFDDLGVSPSGTPVFWLGALAGNAAANSVLKTTTSHFIGVRNNVGSWTRAAGPPVVYTFSNAVTTWQGLKRVGITNTTTTSTTAWRVSADHTKRNAMVIQFVRSGGTIVLSIVICQTAGETLDHSPTALRAALESADMTGAATILNSLVGAGHTAVTYTGIAVNEGVDGAFDSIHFAWDKTAFSPQIDLLAYAKVA